MNNNPQSPNTVRIASFGANDPGFSMGTEVAGTPVAPVPIRPQTQIQDISQSVVADKKRQLEIAALDKKSFLGTTGMTSMQKKAYLGNPEEQQRIALSLMNENTSGHDQSIVDSLDPNMGMMEFRAKYGDEALANRHKFAQVYLAQSNTKAAERTNGDTAWDTAMGLAGVGTNLVGGVATLAAQASDTILTKPLNEITGLDVPYLAPNVADWTQGASEFFRGQKSELAQARSQIHAVEGALNQSDSDIITQREADAAPADEGIVGLIERKASQYGREAAGAISNYADDPIAQGDLVVDAIGSILGIAGAGKIITTQRVGSNLMAKYLGQGLTKQAAKTAVKAELKTDAGKLLLAKAAERNIIPIIGATEGGSSVADTLNQIKGMTPEDFKDNDAYNALEDQGLTHEEITDELAHQAGNITAPIAVGVALGAGRLVSKFAANPFSTTARTTAAEAGASTVGKQIAKRGGEVGKNVAFETTEEAIQEGGAAFATNAGLKGSGVDPELALDKGVAARAAEGALGGLAGAGALQAPGLAGGVAKDTAKGALDVVGKAVDARVKVADEKSIAAAANNPTARTEAAVNAGVAHTALTEALNTSAVPKEGADGQVVEGAVKKVEADRKLIEERMSESNVLTDSELLSNFTSKFSQAQAAVKAKSSVNRQEHFQAMEAAFNSSEIDQEGKREAALAGYISVFKILRANASDVQEALGSFAENSSVLAKHKALVSQNQVVLSSPFVAQAGEVVSKLTKEDFEALPDVQKVLSGTADVNTVAWVAETVAFVGQINSAAVSGILVEKSLNQVNARIKKDGSNVSPQWRNLQEELSRVKALMDNVQEHAANTSLIEGARGTLKASGDPANTRNASSVRENILFTQNPFNGLPSVAENEMDFAKANLSGDRDAAYVALANMRDFATVMRNKTEALDKSSYIKTKEGEAPKNKVAFMSRNEKGPFKDTEGVYANTDISSSVINAYEVRYDAVAVANAYNIMRQNPAFVNDPEFNKDIEVAAFTKNLDDAGYRNKLANIGKIDPNAPGVTGAEEKSKADAKAAEAKIKAEAEAKAAEEAAATKAAADAKAKADAAAAAASVVEGKVKTQKIITVEDARANPDTIFVFGDNLIGKGKRGQAVIRDEPNAIGIPTKRLPSMNDDAFFGQDVAEEKAAITTAINKIMVARKSGKNVIFPEDGVGTGLANLQDKSPEVYAHLQSELVRAGLISAPEVVTAAPVVEGKGSEPWFNAIKDTLVQTGKGVNYFLRGFKPKKSGLSLAQFTDPVDHFLEGVGQLKAEENGLTRELSEKEHAAASTLLVDVYPKFKKRFDDAVGAVLNKTYSGKKHKHLLGKTYQQILTEETTDPTLYDAKQLILMSKETLPLNLLENQGDAAGKLVMNEGAIQAVFMATMEWLAKDNARGKSFMKDEDISKIFYKGNKDGYVTRQMREAVQGGTDTSRALDEISRSTMNLLGVSKDGNVTTDLTQGLFKALASSALDMMTSRDQNGDLIKDNNKILDMRFTEVIIEPKSDEDIVAYKKTHPLSREKPEYNEKELSITKKYLTVQLNKDHPLAKEEGVFANLKSMTDVFSQTFTSSSEKVRYVGAPPKNVDKTQQRSKTADLSERVQGVIKNLENTASFVNMPMFGFVEALGKTNYRDLMGYIDTSTGEFGSVHKVSIEGKNKSITSAIDGTYAYIEDAIQMAEVEGKKFEDIPHFFKWAMTKVGRLMQVGLVTQQGDKFMREMIASTNSKLNMSNPDHEKFLWLAIAQSIGVNPAKTSHEEAITKTKKILEDKKGLGPAARLLTNWVNNGSKPMTEKQTASLKKYLGDYSKRSGQPVTDKMIHALVTHAQLENAISLAPDGIPREFKTALALESDGVTDGIINALMHMTTGEFTKEFFELVAKGGVLFSKDPTAKVTLNEFISLHGKNQDGSSKYLDIYNMVSKHFAKSMQEDLDTSTVDERAYKEALYRLVQAFVPAFNANGGVFTILRDFVKNPSTVLIYGSSAGGIAGKINGELMSGYHSLLNDIAQGKKDRMSEDVVSIMKDIQFVAGFENTDDKGKTTFEREALVGAWNNPTAKNATLSRKTIESLRVAIEKNIAETLTDSIDVITGGLQAEMKFTQRISNLQAELFKYSFEKAIKAKKEAKFAAFKAGTATADLRDSENLTENEIQQIFQEMMKVAPIYQGADTNFDISSGEQIDSDSEISRSFSGRIPGNVSRPTVRDAGVKVSPYMTIGVGDGGMIVEIYGDGSVEVKNTLPIYDGVEQGLENVIESSRRINKGAHDGWMNGDIHGPIHQSFAQTLSFFSEADYNALPTKTQTAIQRSLGYYTNQKTQETKRTKKLGQAPWKGYASILEELKLSEAKAMSSKARKAVFGRMGMHSDHMSVAEAPYVTSGEGISSGNVRDYPAIAELANRLYKEEMVKLEGTRDKTRAQPAIQAPTPTMINLVQALGKPVQGFKDVTVVTGAQLLPRLITDIGANKNQITMLRDILKKDPAFLQTDFYFGDSADLGKVRAKYHPDLAKMDENSPIEAGVMYPYANVAFISNLAPETLLHEMLHKQVNEILQLVEQGSDKAPAHAVEAYARLKSMVQYVRKMKTGTMPENQQASMKILLDVLNKNEGDSYTQVSELISWGLSNQNIVEQFKNQRVDSPFIKIVNKVLQYLSQALGIKMHGKDLYANLKFNTEVLLAPETPKQKENKTKAQEKGLANETSSTVLEIVEGINQSEDDVIDMEDISWEVEKERSLNQVFGEDYSLETVENRFQKKLNSELQKYANASTVLDLEIKAQLQKSVSQATDAANYFGSQGLGLNAREHLAFRSVHSVMTGVFKMDAGAMSRAAKMYRHFINTVTEDDFHTVNGADLTNLTAADKALVKTQFSALTGKDGIRKQAGGQAELMAGFIALAQVHPGMRSIVEDMVPPKDTEFKNKTFDDMVKSSTEAAVSLITRYTTSQDKPKGNVAQELAVITGALTEVTKESNMLAMLVKLDPTERANSAVSGFIDKVSSAASYRLGEAFIAADARGAGRLVKGPLLAATIVTAFGSKAASTEIGKKLTAMMNRVEGYHTLRSLMTDIQGQTDDNKALYKLLNQAKAVIDRMRQNFRDDVPANLESYFKTKPTKQQWAHFTQGIAKTGVMDIGRSQGLALIKDMSQLALATQKQEEAVRALGGNLTNRYMTKAKMLAQYMMTGETNSANLLMNTYAISHLVNEGVNISARAKANSSVDLFEAIDKLVSLYAVGMMDPDAKATLEYMAKNEPVGLEKVAGYLETMTKLEKEKLGANTITNPQDVGRLYNGRKGFIPSTPMRGASVMIADDLDHTIMERKGYTKGAKYHGDPSENYQGTRSEYYSSVAGRNNYRQGAAQTVRSSYMGTDMKTGLTMDGTMGRAILGKPVGAVKRRIYNKYANRSMDNLPTGDHLLPKFDENGVVSAYERPLAPDLIAKLNKDENMGRMLGVWAGRIFEEAHAREVNEKLFQLIKADYDRDYAKDPSQYTNVADPKHPDPVIKDAWRVLGPEGKILAEKYFGSKDEMWIRKDMVDNAIGYRKAGVTDPWTGVTRWSPETQENMKNAAIALMGNPAYSYLVKGETAIQDVVSYTKDTLIVRSLVVMFDNFTSNKLQLMTWGIGPKAIYDGTRAKGLEALEYNKNIKRINALNADMAASIDSLTSRKVDQMEAEIAALEAANAKMSIAVLIEAGEFSTVSEGLDEDDQDIRESRFAEYLEKAVNKLPSKGKTILKNVVMSKDTAIYQGLNRMVQYSDFIDKAILYDHLTQKKGMTKDEALDVIRDEFVAYNLVPGRVRDFFETNGMLYFYNYKLRIMKVAMRTMRDRPVSALLFGGIVGPELGIDSVSSGALATQALNGDLIMSVGPGMGINSLTMNPVEGVLTSAF